MYVSYEDFNTVSNGYLLATPNETGEEVETPKAISEAEYMRLAPIADAIIDDWTLERVGRAVENGEELPRIVITVYAAIIDNLPALISNSKVESGAEVSSFSNGIDSFSFDTQSGVKDQLTRSLGWLIDLLPIEWSSAVVSYKGGNHAR